MNKILFYAQNNGQASNVKLLLEELETKGFLVSIYDTANIYYQPIDYNGFQYIEMNPIALNHSFYRSSLIERIKSVIRLEKHLQSLAQKYDMLLVAADGAFERILINEFNKKGKKTIMLIDGIISDYSTSINELLKHPSLLMPTLRGYTKRFLFNIFKTTPMSPFLPSQIGMMPLDKILVMGEHSKKCIKKINHYSKVVASGMPRLYNQHVERKALGVEPYYVCYFPSAFKWHHSENDDINQHADIRNVCEVISSIREKEHKDIRLIVKMHPRESVEDYKSYCEKYNFVSLEINISVIECFERYHLFLSNVSTVIVEGLINNIRVHSLMMNFEFWRFKKSFLASNEIGKVFSEDDLYKLIKYCAMGEDCVRISPAMHSSLFEKNCSPQEIVNYIID